MVPDNLLLIFIKNPVRGKVKTRLAASIGAERALAVYGQLLRYTHQVTKSVQADKMLFYSDAVDETDFWERNQFQKFVQQGNTLGERMMNAFATGFGRNYKHIVIIGSDCPQLATAHIEQAFKVLQEKDVVIGPASDGGYYLLGMNRLHPELFSGKQWSTSTVLSETLTDVQRLQLSYELLPELTDIDEEKDLHLLPEA